MKAQGLKRVAKELPKKLAADREREAHVRAMTEAEAAEAEELDLWHQLRYRDVINGKGRKP